jgi:hypothetical protein
VLGICLCFFICYLEFKPVIVLAGDLCYSLST